VDALASLKLTYPKVSQAQSREIAEAKKTLGLTGRANAAAG